MRTAWLSHPWTGRFPPVDGAAETGLCHAYGVAAVAAGVLLSTVAAVLGHADLATTAVYTTAFGADARELVARMWS